MEELLPYRITEDTYFLVDDDETEQMRTWIQGVAEGSEAPASAARLITDFILNKASERSEACARYRREHAGREDDDDDDEEPLQPQPFLYRELVILQAGSAASSIPPSNPGHGRLIDLFHAFADLPSARVPSHAEEERSNRYELWQNRDDMQSMGYQFYEIADANGKSTYNGTRSGIDKPGSAEQQRWRNLQAFLARLCSDPSSLWDCSMYSALFELESHRQFYVWDQEVSKGLRAGHAVAAAQWIVPEEVGSWVYAQCRKRPSLGSDEKKQRPYHNMWTLESWALWRASFQEVADDAEYDDALRGMARLASERMDAIEKE